MRYNDDELHQPESPLRLFNAPLVTLCVVGCFCVLASYSYGKYVAEYAYGVQSIPPVQVTAPKPHAQYFEHLQDRELAEVWGLTPADVKEPIELFKKGDN